MSERKNIERLFQEKFKDFEATPSPQVWENIADELEKKENKKRVIPFWFNMKAAGIAAAFILGTFMVNNYTNTFNLNQSKSDSEIIVSTEKNQIKSSKVENQNLNNSIVESSKNQNSTTSNNVEESITSNRNSLVVIKNQKKNISTDKNNWIVNNSINQDSVIGENKSISLIVSKNKHNKKFTSKNSINFETKNPSNITLVISESGNNKDASNTSSYVIKNSESNQKNNSEILDNSSEIQIVDNSESENLESKASKKSVLNKNKSLIVNHSSENLVQNDNTKNINSSTNLDRNIKEKITNSIDVSPNSLIVNTTIKSIIIPDVIKKDSVIVALVNENPLEKILKEKETKEKEKQEEKIVENTQKWKVKPNVAPLFMSATQGSPIDSQFADNSKSYENTLSLGLGVDYAVSKKLSIRTGINKFDYSYNTNDIVYYADFAAKNTNSISNLKTINVASGAKNMIIEDKNVSNSKEIALQTKDEGFLNQKTGYLEIPVEVSYKLLDKKFGIQIITGFSSLLLNKNEVSIISSGLTTIIGEANNLNKMHFSTNIGLGFKYSFWKSFEANFEPTFKYQLNTYNANSGGFKPYLVGLYSGISFNF